MTTLASPADSGALPAWADAVIATLLPALQQAGLRIDVRTTLLVQTWLIEAAQRGAACAGPADCRAALCALVARSAREQALFDVVFERWLAAASMSDAYSPSGGTPANQSAPVVQTNEVPRWRRIGRKVLRFTLWTVGVLVLLFVLLVAWALVKDWLDKLPPSYSLAQVQQNKTALEIDTGGPRTAPQPASAVAALAASSTGTAGAASAAPQVQTPSVWQVWGQRIANPERTLWGVHPGGYLTLLLLAGALGYTLRRTRQAELARITTRENLREQHVYAGQWLHRGGQRRADARAAARLLRRPVPVAGGRRRLDLPASVQASVREAGLFHPVYREHRQMRQVLVLIERARPGEPLGQRYHELVQALVAEGVAAQIFEFDRDPRWVAPWARLRRGEHAQSLRRVPLASLESAHAGAALLLCSEGHGLLDPRSGQLLPWVARSLAPWPDRALLTPLPLASWGAAEDRLAEPPGAFLVAPAQTLALPLVASWLQGATDLPELPFVPGAPASVPPLLRGPALRWLGNSRPDAADETALLQQLRAYLGPSAFSWLAASAAYPQLSAELTEFLADQLDPPDPHELFGTDAARRREAQWLALAHLPWFRQGHMPDWLRLALLGELAPQTRARVRAALERLLTRPDPHGQLDLGAIATGPAPDTPLPRWRRSWQALRRHWRLQAITQAEAPDSPLRDVIYLGLLGDRIDELLKLRVGSALSHDLQQAGGQFSWNVLRWLAAGLVAVGWLSRWLLWQVRRPMMRGGR